MASDKTLKKNIKELTEEYKKILNLKPVSFNWKEEYNTDNELHYGFIAQDVQQTYPNLVKTDQTNKLAVNYIEMIPLLVSYIQKQHDILEILLKKNN